MSNGSLTLARLNEVHRMFWAKQNALLERRMADPVLSKPVIQELDRYQLRGTPLSDQEGVEYLAEKYDLLRHTVLSEYARRAGRASKADALQKYIIALVRERPHLTERQLLARLEREQGRELVQEIVEGVIHFTQPDGTEEGRTKEAPVSGLKDRLSRAKKQVNSRKRDRASSSS